MALEIERKFLVKRELLPFGIKGERILQGYLHSGELKTIRVRIKEKKASLTIKGPDSNGIRPEFEYRIPLPDARFLLENYCENGKIEKIRRKINWSGKTWEIDEFLGENNNLWLAEIELTRRDEEIDLPRWIGEEVTNDYRFFNSFLAQNPFSSW